MQSVTTTQPKHGAECDIFYKFTVINSFQSCSWNSWTIVGSGLNSDRWSSDLYWDAGLSPLLAQVAVVRDAAVVGWSRQQEDGAQQAVSTREAAEAEQEQQPLLERTPSSQKTHCLIVFLHRSSLILSTSQTHLVLERFQIQLWQFYI